MHQIHFKQIYDWLDGSYTYNNLHRKITITKLQTQYTRCLKLELNHRHNLSYKKNGSCDGVIAVMAM